MRYWILIVACLAMGITVGAQSYRYNLNFTVAERHFVDTIPIEVERGQIYMQVESEGRQLRFKLDTGASQGGIYEDTPIGNLKELGEIRATDATGRENLARVVALPPIRLGRLTINDYPALVNKRQMRRNREDGIIGFNLFNKGIAAKIDTRRGIMVLTDRKQLMKRERGIDLRYRLRMHVPYIIISPSEGVETEVLFDSGSRELFALNTQQFLDIEARHPAVATLEEGRSRGSKAIGHFGTEQEGMVVFLGLKRLAIGCYELRDLHCQTTQGGSHIGAPLLDYGALVVNPFSRKLVLQPTDSLGYSVVGNEHPNIAIVPDADGMPSVGLVWERSDAYRQGFRQGDVIERIDGQRVADFHSFISASYVFDHIYTFTLRDRRGFLKEVRAVMPMLRK